MHLHLNIRLKKSEKLLLETDKTPKEIAVSLGFKDYQKYYTHESHPGQS